MQLLLLLDVSVYWHRYVGGKPAAHGLCGWSGLQLFPKQF